MRANHATEPPRSAPHGGAGAHRAIARWLPRPRAVAAAGALLAQLWGFGAPGAYAAATDPLPAPARPTARRALHGAPVLDRPVLDSPSLDGPALDGQSAERPVGSGPPSAGPPDRSPGPTGAVGDTLRERIRAGGLPLPGQRAAVPDAFALASGLFGTVPAQARPDGLRPSHEGGTADLPAAARHRAGATRPTVPRQRAAAAEARIQEAAAAVDAAGPATALGRTAGSTASPVPDNGRVPVVDTATAATSGDRSAAATAVLAPIAAGLLLTGAAMYKHRGLPRGH
ncbi:hypothetical protein ABZW03_05575 [Kitasatospora sp. NPDC004799]|uniref:hypothetical protein n=1 Tax=Kitasatospora sp. NPDC004799 TaxID=3154460 RepID=UPI00339DE2AE